MVTSAQHTPKQKTRARQYMHAVSTLPASIPCPSKSHGHRPYPGLACSCFCLAAILFDCTESHCLALPTLLLQKVAVIRSYPILRHCAHLPGGHKSVQAHASYTRLKVMTFYTSTTSLQLSANISCQLAPLTGY